MARNGTWLCAIALLAAAAGAEDALLERWDKPRRETFEMPREWPNRVVDTLVERFGVPVELDPVDIKRADFVAKDATFFEALDAFAKLHRLAVITAPRDDDALAIRLVLAERATPVAHLGPTRLSVQGVTVVRARQFGAGNGDDVPLSSFFDATEPKLSLRMRWLAEPGLDGVIITRWKVTAEDDQGKRLHQVTEGWEPPVLPDRPFDLVFAPPSPGAKVIRKIEGTARVALPLEHGRIEFLANEAGQTKRLGGARVQLDKVEAGTVSFTLKGTPCPGVKGDVGVQVGSEDGHGLWAESPARVRMLPYDAEGNEMGRGASTSMSLNWFARRTFTIELEATPTRIVFETLVRGAEREVAFSFADIPLPE